MFQLLLEKNDYTMYQIFCRLEEYPTCSFEQLALHTHKTPLTVQRFLKKWQTTPANQTLGIGLHLDKQAVHAIYSRQSATTFFSHLLRRSTQFQLLMHLMNEPVISSRELQEHFHMSKSTLQRRFAHLQTFLVPYHLSLSFKQAPILKGSEVQIRWLFWQLSLASDPPLFPMAHFYFQRYQTISNKRCQQGFTLTEPWEPPHSVFLTQSFRLDERGLRFLWQQLLGAEEYWAPKEPYECLDFALHRHTSFDPIALAKLHSECHQLHGLCTLYDGPFFIQQPAIINSEVQAVIDTLTHLLPDYQQLLKQHPEIPAFYQYLFDKYHALGTFLVAET